MHIVREYVVSVTTNDVQIRARGYFCNAPASNSFSVSSECRRVSCVSLPPPISLSQISIDFDAPIRLRARAIAREERQTRGLSILGDPHKFLSLVSRLFTIFFFLLNPSRPYATSGRQILMPLPARPGRWGAGGGAPLGPNRPDSRCKVSLRRSGGSVSRHNLTSPRDILATAQCAGMRTNRAKQEGRIKKKRFRFRNARAHTRTRGSPIRRSPRRASFSNTVLSKKLFYR